MADINKILISGRLAVDPDSRNTETGKLVAWFNIASQRRKFGDKEPETDFIKVVSWGKLAQFAVNHLKKGIKIFVDGNIQVRSYEKDGERRKSAEIIADSIHFMESKKSNERYMNREEEEEYDDKETVLENNLPF